MIPSINGASFREVLSDFDRAFGDLPKNPTTYRIPDKLDTSGPNNLILLPGSLNTADVIHNLGRSLGERYFLLASSLYVRGLVSHKDNEDKVAYLPCHSSILRQLGGENYRSLIQYGIEQGHLAKGFKIPVPGVQCFEYRINRRVIPLDTQQRYSLTTVHAKSVRRSYGKRKRDAFAEENAIQDKIARSIDGLVFDYSAAIEFVRNMPEANDRETKAKYRRVRVLNHILFEGGIWSSDKQGRIYTVVVTTPRNLRQFFSYGGEPLWAVDISSSQPLIASLLYEGESDESRHYRSVVEGGGFWDFMNECAGEPYDVVNLDEKTAMKKRIFREVFYAYYKKRAPTSMFGSIFSHEFPILWDRINEHKKQSGRKQSAPLAKEMQRIESEAVQGAINELKAKPYPLITIHDAIITTEDGVEDVKAALLRAFSTANLAPALSVKRVTFNSEVSGEKSDAA